MSLLRPLLPLALLATPALAEPPAVMTDIPAVHALTASVMGDLASPGILLDKGSDPHHFQLKPSQARALEQADLVFWIGPGLTPWLARAIDGVGIRGEAVSLIELPQTHRRAFGEDHAHDDDHDHAEDHAQADAHEHEHEHEHEQDEAADTHKADSHDDHAHDDHGHDDHDHSHAGLDPHAWLDPDNAAAYSANAQMTLAAIDAAEADTAAILAPVGDTPIMVFHDAYGYFAAHFGVHIAGSIAAGDAASPGAARLRDLQTRLQEQDIACIFPEAQHDPAYVTAIVEGTGTRVGGTLDPSGSMLNYGPGLYAALLTGLAGTIADCVAPR